MAVARILSLAKQRAERIAPGAVAAWQRRKLKRALAARRTALPETPRDAQAPVLLFFAPDAGSTPHFVTHLVVARTLKELGHRVLVVRCFRHLLPRCILMEANALSVAATAAERERICERCVRNSLTMIDDYGLETVDLEHVIDDAMRAQVRSMLASAPEDPRMFSIAGTAIGQLANGDLSRMLKMNDPGQMPGEVRVHLREYIESAALSYLAAQRLCRRLNVARLIYFNDYAMTLAAAAAAERENIPTTHLSHVPVLNNDRRRIVMLTGYAPLEGLKRLRAWPAWRDLALPPERVALISEDSFLRFAGSGFTIYSPAWTARSEALFEKLRLDRRRRLLVAYTSSEDEVRGVRFYESALGVEIYPGHSPFSDQFDWLQSLVEHVEASADLQLVIRIHPREAPNKRENRTSENLREMQRRFSAAYANVRVVWPTDPVSSYDLAEIADIGLIALSTIGFELARLGVPVIASLPHLAEAPDGVFVAWNNTRDGYFAALRRALAEQPSLQRLVAAFRWVNARFIEYSVDLGDIIPTGDFATLPPFTMPRLSRVLEEVLVDGRALPDINRERLQSAQRRTSAAAEHAAIARHLRDFLHFLLLGSRPGADYRLVLRGPNTPEARTDDDAGFSASVSGGEVTLRGGGRSATKFSPMAARMVRLLAMASADAGAVEAR